MGAGAVLVLLALAAGLSEQANFLSHTAEDVELINSVQLCPDSPNDLETLGTHNFTAYTRRPQLPQHQRHRRALDQQPLADAPLQEAPDALLEAIYGASLLVPSLAIQNSISNLGDTQRLERFLFKLVTGQPVTVVALGGSVTIGHGPENRQTAWVPRLFKWIESAFPHEDHRLLNEAIPAITSSYIAPCVLSMVPETVDLVIMEFTFNDGERAETDSMEDPTRLGLERLVRKLLRLSSRPAVLNLHYHPFNVYKHYYDKAQDRMEALLKYYAVPSLSMRSALHRLLSEEAWLVGQMWVAKDVHPTCIGYAFVADIVIGYLQDMAAFVHQTYHSQQHLPHPEVLLEQLPEPLFEGNTADKYEKCILEEDFKALENGNNGWEWVDEGRMPNRHKKGFVSWQVGNDIILKVPLAEVPLPEDRRILVALGVLMSYEHHGYVIIVCVNGCVCEPRHINTQHWMRYSMTFWKGLQVSVAEGSETCELYVRNSEHTISNEHKVKLTSMMVSLELASFIESWNY